LTSDAWKKCCRLALRLVGGRRGQAGGRLRAAGRKKRSDGLGCWGRGWRRTVANTACGRARHPTVGRLRVRNDAPAGGPRYRTGQTPEKSFRWSREVRCKSLILWLHGLQKSRRANLLMQQKIPVPDFRTHPSKVPQIPGLSRYLAKFADTCCSAIGFPAFDLPPGRWCRNESTGVAS
jgi:hypothetical protein